MQRRTITTLFFIAVMITASNLIPAQDHSFLIFRLYNLSVTPSTVYEEQIILTPFAPHRIESDIDPIDPSITEPILRIRLESTENSKTTFHRGDVRHANTTFTPRASEYELTITNTGFLDEIRINYTIYQTGPATNTMPSALDFGPLLYVTLISSVVLIIAVSIYKRLWSRQSHAE